MKIASKIFRIKPDHHDDFGLMMDYFKLLMKLKKHGIERSEKWPYSIRPNSEVILKNRFGKKITIKREYSADQLRIIEYNKIE